MVAVVHGHAADRDCFVLPRVFVGKGKAAAAEAVAREQRAARHLRRAVGSVGAVVGFADVFRANGQRRPVDGAGGVIDIGNVVVAAVVAVGHRHALHLHGFFLTGVFVGKGKAAAADAVACEQRAARNLRRAVGSGSAVVGFADVFRADGQRRPVDNDAVRAGAHGVVGGIAAGQSIGYGGGAVACVFAVQCGAADAQTDGIACHHVRMACAGLRQHVGAAVVGAACDDGVRHAQCLAGNGQAGIGPRQGVADVVALLAGVQAAQFQAVIGGVVGAGVLAAAGPVQAAVQRCVQHVGAVVAAADTDAGGAAVIGFVCHAEQIGGTCCDGDGCQKAAQQRAAVAFVDAPAFACAALVVNVPARIGKGLQLLQLRPGFACAIAAAAVDGCAAGIGGGVQAIDHLHRPFTKAQQTARVAAADSDCACGIGVADIAPAIAAAREPSHQTAHIVCTHHIPRGIGVADGSRGVWEVGMRLTHQPAHIVAAVHRRAGVCLIHAGGGAVGQQLPHQRPHTVLPCHAAAQQPHIAQRGVVGHAKQTHATLIGAVDVQSADGVVLPVQHPGKAGAGRANGVPARIAVGRGAGHQRIAAGAAVQIIVQRVIPGQGFGVVVDGLQLLPVGNAPSAAGRAKAACEQDGFLHILAAGHACQRGQDADFITFNGCAASSDDVPDVVVPATESNGICQLFPGFTHATCASCVAIAVATGIRGRIEGIGNLAVDATVLHATHQTTDIRTCRTLHSHRTACCIAISNLGSGGNLPHQTAHIVITIHKPCGIARSNLAVTNAGADQATYRAPIPLHLACCITLLNGSVVAAANQPASKPLASNIACRVAMADVASFAQTHQPSGKPRPFGVVISDGSGCIGMADIRVNALAHQSPHPTGGAGLNHATLQSDIAQCGIVGGSKQADITIALALDGQASDGVTQTVERASKGVGIAADGAKAPRAIPRGGVGLNVAAQHIVTA